MNIDELREKLRDARNASWLAQKAESDLEQRVWLAEIELGLRPRPSEQVNEDIRKVAKRILRTITLETDTIEELD